MDLQESREIINRVDKEMADLFCQRMKAVESVAEYKIQHGLPILDAAREAAVIERNSQFIEDEALRSYYVKFLQNNMALSRRYQQRLVGGMKVAYSGVEGAFAHIAAKRVFPNAELISCSDFRAAYQSVVSGECDCAVLPIENSSAGEVGQVMDLMFSGSLFINGVYTLPIVQNLLGVPGAKVSDITRVISHPQALSQCDGYIEEHGFEAESAVNTARAAKKVKEMNDVHVAAIASAETAELYGLKLLDHDINEDGSNSTRFAVFTRATATVNHSGKGTFLMLFTVRDEAGSLAKAINIIGSYGFNMRSLRSRPMKDLAWNYYFYVEAEGDDTSEEAKQMMKALESVCDKMKIVGYYENNVILKDGE